MMFLAELSELEQSILDSVSFLLALSEIYFLSILRL